MRTNHLYHAVYTCTLYNCITVEICCSTANVDDPIPFCTFLGGDFTRGDGTGGEIFVVCERTTFIRLSLMLWIQSVQNIKNIK